MFGKLDKKTDDELIILLKRNYEPALEEMYNRYESRIYHFAYRFIQSHDVACEITQNAFIKLWENRQSLINDKKVSSWLFTVAKNDLLNYIRSLTKLNSFKKEYSLSVVQSHNPTEEKINMEEYTRLTDRAISELPTQCRSIFHLSRNEGKSYDEIAELMGISRDTVRLQIIKSLKSIRRYLAVNADGSY